MRRLFRQTPVFSARIDELGDDWLLREIEDPFVEAEDISSAEKKIFKSLVADLKGEKK